MISTLGTYGSSPYPGPGLAPIAGPIVTIGLNLALAGPVPADLPVDPPQSCQAGNPNVAILVTVVDQDGNAVDLSTANAMELWLVAPDATVRPVPAAFASNGLDGNIEYVTAPGDLNEAGLWRVQAALTFGARQMVTRLGEFRAI